MKRRSISTRFVMALVAIAVLTVTGIWVSGISDSPGRLVFAQRAASWLASVAVQDDTGLGWAPAPKDSQEIVDNLYQGSAGPVLFFLELHRMTGEDQYLRIARSGADRLAARISVQENHGFYTGLSGVAYTLMKMWQGTGEETYRHALLQALDRIRQEAIHTENGVEWDASTDIISGSAGIGLFLLQAAEELDDDSLIVLAAAAGRDLTARGIPAPGGLKWSAMREYPRIMPNFSHGAGGVAFFLAALYQVTGEQEFLDAALAGARYLEAVADAKDGIFRVYHHEGDGEDLYYLGYCHGPSGTARLFHKLYEVTNDRHWLVRVREAAEAILQTNIPEQQTPGFWNNVGVCCGSSGVAEFLVQAYLLFDDERYLQRAEILTDDLVERSSSAGGGLMWVHAEHRARPDFLQAQTGLMQGAAGIGLWLLQFDEVSAGQAPGLNLPDSSW